MEAFFGDGDGRGPVWGGSTLPTISPTSKHARLQNRRATVTVFTVSITFFSCTHYPNQLHMCQFPGFRPLMSVISWKTEHIALKTHT